MSRKSTAVAISGGIDSLVAAYLLKKAGHPVFGIHFVSGYESPQNPSYDREPPPTGPTAIAQDGEAAAAFGTPLRSDHPLSCVAESLDIEIRVIDCRRTFREKVVNYFIETYQAGRTPNPCMVCNHAIKFGCVLDAARALGAARLATGHYALHEKTEDGRYRLKKGADPRKEQSYFLAMLNQVQLSRALFPVGGLTKQAVAEIAQSHALFSAAGHESQDICFTRGLHYLEFLSGHTDFKPAPGAIVDASGCRIGTHQGLHRYTVGQRRGINCPSAEPYYVIGLDMAGNQLVVGNKKDLYRTECRIRHVNWISGPFAKPLAVMTKIRYRHEPAESELIPINTTEAVIRFKQPQPAITPGQAAVCYQNDTVVAGGWIYE